MAHQDSASVTRSVTVTGTGLPDIMGEPALEFAKLSGHEKMCELFEYELELRTPDERNDAFGPAANLDTHALRGRELTVTITLPEAMGAGTREISGIVTRVSGPVPAERNLAYRITLRPWLWLATLNRDFRIFQNQTVVQTLDELLADFNFPVEKRLDVARYPMRELQVMYGESTFDFFQRLTQEWGIAWHIEHSGGKHRLVLTDGNGAFAPFQGSPGYATLYWQRAPEDIGEEGLETVEIHDQLVAGAWTSNDFDFTRPRADLTVAASDPLDTAHAGAEVREWPGDHSTPGTEGDPWKEGELVARMRMEAIRQHGSRLSGKGNLRAVVPGCTFVLEDFMQRKANREYLVLGAKLTLDEEASDPESSCEVEFIAQPSNELFRPERTQPKPRTGGPQTATVVGPEDQETWTDQYGRVRLQFHWDRLGRHDAGSSCWVRVASAWQGDRFGAQHVPRIGQEVVVDFLNGDPDCPIVTSRVPNEHNMPQWPMPAHHVLSGFVSKEDHGERANTFVQDDTEGQIQTQLQSDHQASGLSLGFIARIMRGVGRKDKRGEGFELRTDAHGVVRAGNGMLLTTERRPNAQAHHKDMAETVQRLAGAQAQQETLAEMAQEVEAQDAGDQAEVAKALKAQNDDIQGSGSANPEAGTFPELAAPHLVLASPAGIEATAAQSLHIASGQHVAVSSTGHISLSSGKRLIASISRGVRIFVQNMGWRLVAAGGDIDLRALRDSINLLAKLDVTATANRITLSAKEELVIVGGGSGTTWNGSGITHKTGSAYAIHAAKVDIASGQKASAQFPEPPEFGKSDVDVAGLYASHATLKSCDVAVEDSHGKVTQGKVDGQGAAPVDSMAPGPARVTFGKDSADPLAASSQFTPPPWPAPDADATQ